MMKDLTKNEARWLMPAIVDSEATDEERFTFFEYIKNDSEVEKEYNDALLIKKALSNARIRKKAPDHLRQSVLATIEELQNERSENNEEKNSTVKPIHSGSSSTNWVRYLSVAAAVLVISLVTLQLLDYSADTVTDDYEVIVENMAAEHFINSGGQLIKPHFSTSQPHEAEAYLQDNFGLNITIPTLKNAEFVGIVMAEFVDDFQTPLLEYRQQSIGETIYLFAFDMDQVVQHNALVRHEGAVDACTKSEDFYVAEVNDHHVVSWLWDNTWYAAISNHNGYDLAALVEPLNYSR